VKTIERYVFGSFLSSFVLAFLVLSFVLTIGLLVQIIGYIMDGVPMDLVGEFCLVSLPETLQWSIPLALLVSAILVFSRMSADSELAAMRACGINLWSVVKWPVLFGFVCTLLGVWVNNEVVTRGHYVRRTLKERVSVGAGLSVLEPGRTIDDFPGVKLWFRSKEGNWLKDVVALDFSKPGLDRQITADKALVTQDGADVKLELYNMTVDPLDEKRRTMARFNRFVYTIRDVLKQGRYDPGTKDMNLKAMLGEIRKCRQAIADSDREQVAQDPQRMSKVKRDFARSELSSTLVEFNKRFVFAMASLCFVLIGIPLGIRSQRKESSIGMAISLAVSLGYYVVVILMLSFEENYNLHPECLIWLPVLVCFALAVKFMRKHL